MTRPARTVGLVAAGTWATKTWPVSHAALLARRLLEAGRDVVLMTGPGEAAVAGSVLRFAPGVRALPPCDVTGIAGVIAHLEAVVGTDSGPRHLAAALDVPTFAWFGPTHPDTWQPPAIVTATGVPRCRAAGCDRVACPHWSCLPALAPDLRRARRARSPGPHRPWTCCRSPSCCWRVTRRRGSKRLLPRLAFAREVVVVVDAATRDGSREVATRHWSARAGARARRLRSAAAVRPRSLPRGMGAVDRHGRTARRGR